MNVSRILKFLCVFLVLALPFSNGIDYSIINHSFAITPLEIAIGLAIGISTIHVLYSEQISVPKYSFIDIFCIVWMVLAVMLSSFVHPLAYPDVIAGQLVWLFLLFITTFYVIYAIGDIALVARAIVLSGSLVGIIAIGQSFFEFWLHIGRPLTAESIERYPIGINRSAGPYSVYGRFGMLMLLSLPISLVAAMEGYSKRLYRHSMTPYVTIALIALGIIASQTRGTIIISMMLVLMLWISYYTSQTNKGGHRLVLWSLAAVVILASFSLLFITHVGMENIESRFGANITAIKIFSNNPLLGVGYGTYSNEAFWASTEVVIHNATFELMVVAGIFGVAPFLIICSLNIYRAFNIIANFKRENFMLLSVALGCLGAIGHTQTFRGIYAEELWFILGLLPALYYSSMTDDHNLQSKLKRK